MKRLLFVSVSIAALATATFAQTPSATAASSPTTTPSLTASPTVAAPPLSDLADKIQQRIEKKFGGRHGVVIETEDVDHHHGGDIPEEVFPIVAICMLAVFGAPVLIVLLAGIFVFSASRQRHRTIRMMVEKGQAVPAELLMPYTRPARKRSDARRGVILMMLGAGVMLWLAAVSDWEGGAWTLGLIPFLIGLGYLIVWKLEGGAKGRTDNPPPLP